MTPEPCYAGVRLPWWRGRAWPRPCLRVQERRWQPTGRYGGSEDRERLSGHRLGRNRGRDTKLTRLLLAHDRQGSVSAVGAVGQATTGVESTAVRARADRQRREHMPTVCVKHDHRLTTAADTEETPVLTVHRQTRRASTGRQRPAVQDAQRLSVELRDFALVHDIDEDMALAVGNGCLGNALERNGSSYGHAGWVHRGGVVAAMVEGEYSMGGRLEHDRIRPAAHLDPADLLECFQVKGRDRVAAAVGSKALAQVGNNGDSMNARRSRNLPHHYFRSGVHDNDAIRARDVQPLRRGVGRQIIPAPFTADGNLPDRRRNGCGGLRPTDAVKAIRIAGSASVVLDIEATPLRTDPAAHSETRRE